MSHLKSVRAIATLPAIVVAGLIVAACAACGGESGGASAGSPKYLFATSQAMTGAFGGLAAADALCTQDALAGGLGGTWKAWLSDNNTNALTRISDVGPWLMAGTSTVAANNRTTLVVGLPATAVRDQNGNVTNGGLNHLWTGTGVGGATGTTCANWASGTSTDKGSTLGTFTNPWTLVDSNCGFPFQLLCIQQ
jgi:hypothetical protein